MLSSILDEMKRKKKNRKNLEKKKRTINNANCVRNSRAAAPLRAHKRARSCVFTSPGYFCTGTEPSRYRQPKIPTV